MKLFIFGASLIYLLGLKMTTKMEFRTHLNPGAAKIESVVKSPVKKSESVGNDLKRIKKDSLLLIKPTSNSLTAPSEKTHK
jgi:hypothetical protein